MNEPTQPNTMDITSLLNEAATLLTTVLAWALSEPKLPRLQGD